MQLYLPYLFSKLTICEENGTIHQARNDSPPKLPAKTRSPLSAIQGKFLNTWLTKAYTIAVELRVTMIPSHSQVEASPLQVALLLCHLQVNSCHLDFRVLRHSDESVLPKDLKL